MSIPYKAKDIDSKQKVVYLIYTDVIGSSTIDYKLTNSEISETILHPVLNWRKRVFIHQLKHLIANDIDIIAVKSVGDAIFFKATINRADENDKCIRLLNNVYTASQILDKNPAPDNDNSFIQVRTVVHRIDTVYSNLDITDELCAEIKNNKLIDRYCRLFIETLKSDIFGNEVNKAIRINGLAQDKAILATDAVVRTLAGSKYNKELVAYNDIPIGDLVFHSPVPILKLKGCYDHFDDNQNRASEQRDTPKKELLIVWQLEKRDTYEKSDDYPVLAREFKSYHLFRLINCQPENFSEQISSIDEVHHFSKEFLKLHFRPNKDDYFINRFHKLLAFYVHDIFSISPISFRRKSEKESRLYNAFNAIVQNVECKSDNRYKAIIKGQFSKLEINVESTTITINKSDDFHGNEERSFLPLLFISAYPNQEIASFAKQQFTVYQWKLPKFNNISVQPQSIPVHNRIVLNTHHLSKKMEANPDANSISLENKYILVFFAVYNKFLSLADLKEDLFSSFLGQHNSEDNYYPLLYGLMSGNIDGFIMYEITNDEESDKCKILESIMRKYFSPLSSSIYEKTYPLSIFLLEGCKEFPVLKKNINYAFQKNQL